MGTYTPNYNLYMPSIGEQGWGELVSNNFEILDTNLNDLQNQITTNLNNLQDQIDVIDTNIGNGTRILSISMPNITINTSNFNNYASYDENNVYYSYFYGNTTFSSIPKPSHSCRLMIIVVHGNATISGNIDTYPTTLQNERPPNSETTNTYNKEIIFNDFSSCTLTYTTNGNNSQLIMNYNDYLSFLGKKLVGENLIGKRYTFSIPAATAAGGSGKYSNGTAGTAENTCNGGGGGSGSNVNFTGGTGCIFGQYESGNNDGSNNRNGYGYGTGGSNKYRSGLVIIASGNLVINRTITQVGGNSTNLGDYGGYGGGAVSAGGGGAPVFIYYTGTYINNGTINTAGGRGYYADDGDGGAGGIKTTKISLQ